MTITPRVAPLVRKNLVRDSGERRKRAMNRKDLEGYELTAKVDMKQLFPKGSKSFFDANPLSDPTSTPKNALAGLAGGKKRGSMNKTEREFAMILEAMKRKGEILRYEYEGITLRWNGITYTPDFTVFVRRHQFAPTWFAHEIKLIEVKGAYTKGKFERAVERFRHARTYWTEFTFEMHQKTKDGWKQVI